MKKLVTEKIKPKRLLSIPISFYAITLFLLLITIVIADTPTSSSSSGGSVTTTASVSSGGGSVNRLQTETTSTSGQRSNTWLRAIYGAQSSYGTGISSLFMSKDDIDQNKLEAERKLNTIFGFTGGNIPGSVESYVYLMCKAHIPTTGNGLAVIDTDNGATILAYVSGKRIIYTQYNYTSLTDYTSQEKYIYKFSFKVVNKDGINTTLGFNVYVDDTKLYNDTIKLEDGQSFDKTNNNMVIKVSSNKFSKICIKFVTRDLLVRLDDKQQYLSKLCNTIVDGGSTTGTDYTPQGYGLSLSGSSGTTSTGTGSSSSSSSGSGNGQSQSANDI